MYIMKEVEIEIEASEVAGEISCEDMLTEYSMGEIAQYCSENAEHFAVGLDSGERTEILKALGAVDKTTEPEVQDYVALSEEQTNALNCAIQFIEATAQVINGDVNAAGSFANETAEILKSIRNDYADKGTASV